ncbi:hypothetical protein JXD38_06885 [candidate division WOR-3 bacterium]|nr:hypothetical protein [candidate division WOR-3 bacterium]
MEATYRALLVLLVLLALATAASAQEPVVIRLNDAVGDTIDRAERDSFSLFPNTAGFEQAAVLELPGPEILAEVTLAQGDSSRHIFYRLEPNQLERIRFLVNSRDIVAAQLDSDSGAAQALAAFWQELEEHPLRSIAGEPATADEPPVPKATAESRFSYALHGATLGSVVGGCIGAYAGYTLEVPGHFEEQQCCDIWVSPRYSVDLPIVMATSIGATAVAGVAGYAIGAAQDRRPAPVRLESEGNEWRIGCAGAGVLPAIGLGILAYAAARGTMFGRERDWTYTIENDPDGWSALPAVLTGLCVSVEVVTISYQIGRMIDRRKAKEAEARQRALGREP